MNFFVDMKIVVWCKGSTAPYFATRLNPSIIVFSSDIIIAEIGYFEVRNNDIREERRNP